MITIINRNIWKILGIFYKNKNQPIHLREIARKINLSECPTSRHLNSLLKEDILRFTKEANLKKFYINPRLIPQVFPLYDSEKFENLPLLRRKALKYYLNNVPDKPIFIILFGSTAKGTYKAKSDIDIIEVYNKKSDNKSAINYAEAQTSLRINPLQLTFKQFIEELTTKKDYVIQSGLESGFPIYNHKYFYEVLYNERI